MTRQELRRWREARHLTQAQLADILGCSVRVVSAKERGETRITKGDEALLREAWKFGLIRDE